ncbi:MAG: cation:proton antiporter, partial [Microcoleaceae cyanobacterium]
MTEMTIVWMALPFFVGFVVYLIPQLSRFFVLGIALSSAAYAGQVFSSNSSFTLELIDHFGVSLMIDQLSGFFILTNALVTAAVVVYCWGSDKTAF